MPQKSAFLRMKSEFSWGHVYFFGQIFQGARLFQEARLFQTLEYLSYPSMTRTVIEKAVSPYHISFTRTLNPS